MTKTVDNGQATDQPTMQKPEVVSAQAWEAARQNLLVKEKAHTRARDALAAERRRMPWMAVTKEYVFEGPDGKASLLDLFAGRHQLIVYRAFYEPGVYGWPEHACRGCSMVADQVAHLSHLNARDTTLVFASRAPQADIARLKARMGWTMPWYTITDNFDLDFGVDEWHGHNVFFRDGDRLFRTYFINNRGDEQMGGTWNYLDITPLGRQEVWEDSPEGYPKPRPTSGGTGTTATSKAPRPIGAGSKSRTPARQRCEARTRARCDERQPLCRRARTSPDGSAEGGRRARPCGVANLRAHGDFDWRMGHRGRADVVRRRAGPADRGMTVMYLLMSIFHLAPWLRLLRATKPEAA